MKSKRSLRNSLVSQRKFIIQLSAQKELIEFMKEKIKFFKDEIAELQKRGGSSRIELNKCILLAELGNEISVEVNYALKRQGIKTLGQLAEFTEEDILEFKNIDWKRLKEIKSLLKKYGLGLSYYRFRGGRWY